MDEETDLVEQLDPKLTGGGNLDILKMNIGRQMDRINRCFDSLNSTEGNEAFVFMKAATHVKILDAMMNFKAGSLYKEQTVFLLATIEKYEEEIMHPPGKGLAEWYYYIRPLLKWYGLECAELSNLGLIPYDKQSNYEVHSKEYYEEKGSDDQESS